MKGFTLIESMIVIAILAILALFSINTITEFQRNSILASVTQELGSTLRVAQQNSTSGKVKPGETDGTYGITLSGNSYQLVRYTSGSDPETLEEHSVDPAITISPNPVTLTFSRITGLPDSAQTITLTRTGTASTRAITVNANGLIRL